jgi:hypothetical protein
MNAAAWTEFLDRELLRLALFVSAGSVIAPLAAVTRHSD